MKDSFHRWARRKDKTNTVMKTGYTNRIEHTSFLCLTHKRTFNTNAGIVVSRNRANRASQTSSFKSIEYPFKKTFRISIVAKPPHHQLNRILVSLVICRPVLCSVEFSCDNGFLEGYRAMGLPWMYSSTMT